MKLKGRIFDGQDLHENSELSFDENTGTVEYLEDARGTANKDVTILPGLIDTHIHFFGTGNHNLMDWVLTPESLITVRAVNEAKALLNAGFTTVRTLGDRVSLGMSSAEKEGSLYGPRIISAGFSIAETGGNDDPKRLTLDASKNVSYSYYCDNPWDCRKAVRMNIRQGAEATKAYASRSFTGGGRIKEELTVEELSAITDETHRASMRAAAHAYGEQAVSNTINAGFDSVEHGLGLTEDLAEAMAMKEIFYTPTLTIYNKEREDSVPYRDELIKRHLTADVEIAREAGVRIAVGTDFVGTPENPHGMNYRELASLSRIIGNTGALVAGTSTAAECVGLNNVGKLEKGFSADIVAVKGNPVIDIERLSPENILFVAKRGVVFKNLMSE